MPTESQLLWAQCWFDYYMSKELGKMVIQSVYRYECQLVSMVIHQLLISSFILMNSINPDLLRFQTVLD